MLQSIKNHLLAYAAGAGLIILFFAVGLTQPNFFANLTGAITGYTINPPTTVTTTGLTPGNTGTLVLPVCGNGIKETGEDCDDGNTINGDDCNSTCQKEYTYTQTFQCGNGKKEGNEICDGKDFGTKSCKTQGYDEGNLICSSNCSVILTDNCYYTPVCGNGKKETGEYCDRGDLNNQSCGSQNFDGGTLRCASDCTFDTSECYKCGNGKKEANEECDKNDLGNNTCGQLNYTGGSLACKSNCTLDTSECYKCGDGRKDPTEACDGQDLGGRKCADYTSYSGGTLKCTNKCTFDKSACIPKTSDNTGIDGSKVVDNNGSDTSGSTYSAGYGDNVTPTNTGQDSSYSTDTQYSTAYGSYPTITFRGKKITCDPDTMRTLLGLLCHIIPVTQPADR